MPSLLPFSLHPASPWCEFEWTEESNKLNKFWKVNRIQFLKIRLSTLYLDNFSDEYLQIAWHWLLCIVAFEYMSSM